MSYTNGPWYVHSTGKHWNNPDLENLEICYGKDDECICDTVYKKDDANLIASAPELLEALKDCTEWMEGLRASGDAGNWDWKDDEYTKAMDVIAKAEGKQDV